MKKFLSYLAVSLLLAIVLCPRPGMTAVNRESEVREAVTDFITTRTADMGWEVRIRRITISGTLKLPPGTLDYEVLAPQQWEGWGTASMAVLARQNDRLVQNIPVRVDVEARTDMVVALRQIEHGTTIAAGDITLQKREISHNSNRAAHRIEEVVGKKVRTSLKTNQVVRSDQVEKVPLIKSGQLVTIIAENDVMKVTVLGKARSSGAEGDIITVQNQNSFKEISARVLNATTVQVAF